MHCILTIFKTQPVFAYCNTPILYQRCPEIVEFEQIPISKSKSNNNSSCARNHFFQSRVGFYIFLGITNKQYGRNECIWYICMMHQFYIGTLGKYIFAILVKEYNYNHIRKPFVFFVSFYTFAHSKRRPNGSASLNVLRQLLLCN